MRIGELAARSGFTVETIRFYEAEGLLPSAKRAQNNYRVYSENHLERLHFIRHCRSLDMSLEDIAKLVSFSANSVEDGADVHAMIAEHIKAVTERIRELQALKKHLLALNDRCDGKHHGKPCGILLGLSEDAASGKCHCADRH